MRRRLPSTIPPRLLLDPLFSQLQPAVEAGPQPATALLDMLAATASSMDSVQAAQHHEHMFLFILRALDVRSLQPPSLVRPCALYAGA